MFTTVNSNSGVNWNYQGTDIKTLTANWCDTRNTVSSNSAIWVLSGISVETDPVFTAWSNTNSTNLLNTLTTVQTNSAVNWNYQGTDIKTLTGNWQNTSNVFATQSANNGSVYSNVNSNSANWNTAYTNSSNLNLKANLSGNNNFTAGNTITIPSISATIVSGLALVNPTLATNGLTQYSPAIKWIGSGYTTGGGASAQNWYSYAVPAQYTGTLPIGGGAPLIGYWKMYGDVNGSQNNVRNGYAGFNDMKLDLHGTLWLNSYTGRNLALGGTPEAGTANGTFDTSSGIFLSKNHRIGWVNGFNALGVVGDIELARDDVGILAAKNNANLTSPSVFRLYNTYTSTSNNEFFMADWQSKASTCRIGTSAGSVGGIVRPIDITLGNTTAVTFTSAGNTLFAGNVTLSAVGGSLLVREGTNAISGLATLSSGTVTVSTTKVTANSRIYLTINGGTLANVGTPYISARVAGTSFTITSTNVLDASNVAWFIIEPA